MPSHVCAGSQRVACAAQELSAALQTMTEERDALRQRNTMLGRMQALQPPALGDVRLPLVLCKSV